MDFLSQLFKDKWNPSNFFLLAGPCAVENEEVCMQIAKKINGLCEQYAIPYIFKASYRKANRSNINSFTGIGDDKALAILQKVKDSFNIPIVTDIHTEQEAVMAAEVADVLQIPAFLCRQTTLLQAAAKTGKIVNIKKGQFLNAQSMSFAAKKVADSGNPNIMLTERGNSFGYTDLVVDFRNIPLLQETGYPVIMDCTHAVQQPNQPAGVTAGTPQYVQTMAKCGLAAGAQGLFIETHPDPANAKSDGANMLNIKDLDKLIQSLVRLKKAL